MSVSGQLGNARFHRFSTILLFLNRRWIFIRNTLIISAIASVIVVIFLLVTRNQPEQYDTSFVDPYYNDSLGQHLIIYRKGWSGNPPKISPIPLQHPVDVVIVSCDFRKFCNTSNTCSAAVRNLQKFHQSINHFPDIGYNFMIGGDGHIYVGVGWDFKNIIHKKASIGINFLGNYVYDELTEDMVDAFHELIVQGLQLKKLSNSFKLVGENQTNPKVYLSPGVNIYKIIKNWSHFYSGTWF